MSIKLLITLEKSMKSKGEIIAFNYINLWLVVNDYLWNSFCSKKPTVYVNLRPKFLKGLELDFYIPSLRVAFEFQGEQHYSANNDFCPTTKYLLKRVFDDLQKDYMCKKKGIVLVKLNTLDIRTLTSFTCRLRNTVWNYYGYSYNDSKRLKFLTGNDGKSSFCSLPPINIDSKHRILWLSLRRWSKYLDSYRVFSMLKDIRKVSEEYFKKAVITNHSGYGLKQMYRTGNSKNFSHLFNIVLDRIKRGDMPSDVMKLRVSDPLSCVIEYGTTVFY